MIVEFTLIFTLFLGLIGLLIDGSRLMLLQNRTTFAASSAAAASAKQLDGKSGAIARAQSAALAVATANAPNDGLTSSTVPIIEILSALPNTTAATDDQAKFVRVGLSSTTQSLFVLSPPTLSSSASATD